MSRRKSRETIIKILYRNEFHPHLLSESHLNKDFLNRLNKTDRQFVSDRLKKIQEHKKSIDRVIKKHSKNWKKERISLVDLNIIRLAVFEILFCPQVPDKTAINEALELAKRFGEKKSRLFINGILDQVLKNDS